MSQLSSHAADYLELRRALGFKLAKEGRLLPDFAAFTEAAGAGIRPSDGLPSRMAQARCGPRSG